ncbi:MAG: hypothetical protein ACOH1V_10410 [Stenotrophomonas sp.]
MATLSHLSLGMIGVAARYGSEHEQITARVTQTARRSANPATISALTATLVSSPLNPGATGNPYGMTNKEKRDSGSSINSKSPAPR